MIAQQLADTIAATIRDGTIAPGSRLPTVREMAAERGVDRNTVQRAYALLARRGLVIADGRRGTRVCDALVAIGAHDHAATINYVGSHDFSLDLLRSVLRERGIRLEMRAVGSLSGLTALAQGTATIAGTHVPDAAVGSFNHDAVRHALPGERLMLVTLAEREQGLIVRRGNPLQLRTVAALADPQVRSVGRQPGSGTSLLLDRLLLTTGCAVTPQIVATTHLEAAAAVAADRADCALGVRAAAQALDLSFVPLVQERFDLVLRDRDRDQPWFGTLIETLASARFRERVEALGGYDASRMAWIEQIFYPTKATVS